MQPFDPNKSKRSKLSSTISDLFQKSSFSEKTSFMAKLLNAFSVAQLEVLFELCRNIFRSTQKPRRNWSKEKSLTAGSITNEPSFTNGNVNSSTVDPAELDGGMVKQLLYDILEKLPIEEGNKFVRKIPVLNLASSPTLYKLARTYFLNKNKDLGRLRLYPQASLPACPMPGSAKSSRSSNSGKLIPQLSEALQVVQIEWKITERMELCAFLMKESEADIINAFQEQIISRLKQAINIDYLPDHLLLYIMSYLGPSDISQCGATCHRWYDLAHSQRLWQFKCIEMGRKLLYCPDLSMVVSLAINNRIAKNQHSKPKTTGSESRIDWKAVCKLVVTTALARRKATETVAVRIEKSHYKLLNLDTKQKGPAPEEAVIDEIGDLVTEEEAEPALPPPPPVQASLSPVQMFPSRKLAGAETNSKKSTEWQLKDLLSDDADSLPDANKEQDARAQSALAKANVYVQARSIVRPTVPVYPDVEKALKTIVQEVLDTKVLQGHMGVILCLYFDNARLYSGGADNVIRLWHPRGNRCLLKFLGHKGGVHALDYCAETSILFSGSWDTTIRIWDVGQSKAAGIMSGHRGTVTGVLVISATLLLSSSNDGTLRLWNTVGCECIAECSLLPGPQSDLRSLLRLVVLSPERPDVFNNKQTFQNQIVSLTLCADASVFITSLVVQSHLPIGQKEREENSAENDEKTVTVRWVPWASLNSAHVTQQGTAMALHGELLIVATYGQKRSRPVIIGRQPEEIKIGHDSGSSQNGIDGGVLWLARIAASKPEDGESSEMSDDSPRSALSRKSLHDQRKLLTPELFAAINVRTMPTALFCVFGKLYVGMLDGSIQLWDLGDLVLILEFRPHTSRVRDIRASLDIVTSCDDDGKIVVTRLTPAMPGGRKGAVVLK